MFDILNERYEKRHPSLLLSNLTPGEVKTFLGERVYDRLREDGGQCVPFDWESYRRKAA
jgi:DNA replication protein DnaC